MEHHLPTGGLRRPPHSSQVGAFTVGLNATMPSILPESPVQPRSQEGWYDALPSRFAWLSGALVHYTSSVSGRGASGVVPPCNHARQVAHSRSSVGIGSKQCAQGCFPLGKRNLGLLNIDRDIYAILLERVVVEERDEIRPHSDHFSPLGDPSFDDALVCQEEVSFNQASPRSGLFQPYSRKTVANPISGYGFFFLSMQASS